MGNADGLHTERQTRRPATVCKQGVAASCGRQPHYNIQHDPVCPPINHMIYSRGPSLCASKRAFTDERDPVSPSPSEQAEPRVRAVVCLAVMDTTGYCGLTDNNWATYFMSTGGWNMFDMDSWASGMIDCDTGAGEVVECCKHDSGKISR
ncbi:hypothetical protein J6590_033720 [Homalodisca vitripennis]|nr:hypothetical protein J6590_033720 [Homalodisca vitripennis]